MVKLDKIFSVDIQDFSVVIYFLGIKITLSALYNFLYGNPLKTNCTIINLKELLKKGTNFPHPLGIVIAPEVEIGTNCTINQNVTIGTMGKLGENKYKFPKIGNNVVICAGAVVIGGIKIGDNSIIAANAVVRDDVAPNTLVAGIPAQYIKTYEQQKDCTPV